MSERYSIAVVGAGASGMAAAVTAARLQRGVVLLEAQSRVGRKLLSTGNGRCNITNANIAPERYRSGSGDRVRRLLKATPPEEIMGFLRSVGVECFEEREGRIYPRSEQASTVLDMLRAELNRLGVQTICDCRISAVRKTADGYILRGGEESVSAGRVIVACGSQAAPQLGGCRDGFTLMRALGHSSTPTAPALVPLEVDSEQLKALKGVRSRCRMTLLCKGKTIYTEEGELQFNENNLSGIVTMQMASRVVRQSTGCVLSVDLMPEYSSQALSALLRERRERLGFLTAESFLSGLMNKRLAVCLLKLAGVRELSRMASGLSDRELGDLASIVKDWRFTVTGTLGFKQAQVMSGGVPLDEFDDTLESRLAPGLFACGEVLDCDGDCGGYNLHWAWCTGIAAGRAAAGGSGKERNL